MKSVTIHIDGMTCHGCVKGVMRALETLPVADVAVSLEDKRATLQYDDSKTSVEALIAAIENAGFDAHA